MPRYDYECDACQHRFELKQSFDADPVATCPRCEAAAHRKIHSVPVMFKGSGWYVNDYGKRGSVLGTGPEAKPAENGAKQESKSDSADKVEAKAEKKAQTAAEAQKKSDSSAKAESASESKAKDKTPAAEAKEKAQAAKAKAD